MPTLSVYVPHAYQMLGNADVYVLVPGPYPVVVDQALLKWEEMTRESFPAAFKPDLPPLPGWSQMCCAIGLISRLDSGLHVPLVDWDEEPAKVLQKAGAALERIAGEIGPVWLYSTMRGTHAAFWTAALELGEYLSVLAELDACTGFRAFTAMRGFSVMRAFGKYVSPDRALEEVIGKPPRTVHAESWELKRCHDRLTELWPALAAAVAV